MTEQEEAEMEARRRVIRYVRSLMSERGWTDDHLLDATGVNKDTLSDFLNTARWPQRQTRTAIERALDIELGRLDMIRRGLVDIGDAGDPVEDAINRSSLTRQNKLRLISFYLDMLDAQRGQAQGGGSA